MQAKIPVIAIIDVGKTNKKLFLFDEQYKIVYERSARLTETTDEDGDACESLESLRLSVFDSMHDVFGKKEFEVKAVNFSTYGASFVYIGEEGRPIAPLYNYLKPYNPTLQKEFYDKYGGEAQFSFTTASPVLGNLNSGLQLYRIKHQKPELYSQIKYALHLPQYMSYLLSGHVCSDITSIGCHTALWDFTKNDYHEWVYAEGINQKLAPIAPSNEVVPAAFFGNNYGVGIGLHDSSAALIPYQVSFSEPFVLISTGTWCISLNPFNNSPLTMAELEQDCLCYMHYKGKPVKASRLFSGQEHEGEVKRIAAHFHQNAVRYRTMPFNAAMAARLQAKNKEEKTLQTLDQKFPFVKRDLKDFENDEEAYHQLMTDLVNQQFYSTSLVLKGSDVKRIFVDGGFSKNEIYMNLLAAGFPAMEVYAASVAQATAMGTALAIHNAWNSKSLPSNIIELKYYAVIHQALL